MKAKKIGYALLVLVIINFNVLYSMTPDNSQKIKLLGLLANKNTISVSIGSIEKKIAMEKISIYDPYNKEIKTEFTGFYFENFIKLYSAKEASSVKIKAIDGYQVKISFKDIKKENMFLAIKDKDGYLGIDRMGPTRVIYPLKNKIPQDVILKIGTNWIWQANSFEFVK
jgi:hypothetical protein